MFSIKKTTLVVLGSYVFFLCSMPLHGSEHGSMEEIIRHPSPKSNFSHVLPHGNESDMNPMKAFSQLSESTVIHARVSEIKESKNTELQSKICELEKRIVTYRWITTGLTLVTTGFVVKEIVTRYPDFFPSIGIWLAKAIHKASAS